MDIFDKPEEKKRTRYEMMFKGPQGHGYDLYVAYRELERYVGQIEELHKHGESEMASKMFDELKIELERINKRISWLDSQFQKTFSV